MAVPGTGGARLRADADDRYEDFDDWLEALPVDEPVSTTKLVADADPRADPPAVRTLPPWTPMPDATVVSLQSSLRSSFSRMFGLRPAQLVALDEWWSYRQLGGRVAIGRRLVLEEPRRTNGGAWRITGRLRAPLRARSIPIEIALWPRLDAWTKLSVEPQRGVHVSRRYFRSGHRVLDRFCTELMHELPMTETA